MQHQNTDSDRRRLQGPTRAIPTDGTSARQKRVTANAGGGIARIETGLGTLGFGLLALLIAAQVADKKLKGGEL